MPAAMRSLAALAACTLLTAASPLPQLTGTYHADCAPYDGLAFRISLALPDRRRLDLTANVPLEQMTGRWIHTAGSRPGSAMIVLCQTVPETSCAYPQSGTFTVSGKPGRPATGTFDAVFTGGTPLSGRFTAKPSAGADRVLCG